jgi:hypothetical protein
MLSTVVPWGLCEEVREAASVDWCMVDGTLDTVPSIGE